MTRYPVIRPIPILYQDEWVAVVHKPAGLLVHPGPEAPDRDTMISRMRRQLGGYVQPCHRLDRGTSGALLLALKPEVAPIIFKAFQERRVEKRYQAIVRGYVDQVEMTLDYPLEGRNAISHIRGLEHFCIPFAVSKYPTGRYSLVEIRPHTGRRHQVRHHLRHLSHPVVGDIKYGDSAHNRFLYQVLGWKRLALASVGISLVHPVLGRPLVVECPLAWELQALTEQMREMSAQC